MCLSLLLVLLSVSVAGAQECSPRAVVARPGGVQVVYGSRAGTTLTCLAGPLSDLAYSQEKGWSADSVSTESYRIQGDPTAVPVDVTASCGGEAFSLIVMPPGQENERCYTGPLKFFPAVVVPDTPGTAVFEASSSDLNRISCLSGTIADFAYSQEKLASVKLLGERELLVKFALKLKDQIKIYASEPAEVTFSCGGHSYSLILVPRRIPSAVLEIGQPANKPAQLGMPAGPLGQSSVLLLPVR